MTTPTPASSATAAIAAIAIALLAGTANAQGRPEGPACGDMRLFETLETITFVDTGDPGVGPGDRRILHSTVRDEAGEHVAMFYVITTVLQHHEEGDLAMAAGHIVFANGDIKVSTFINLPDAENLEESTEAPIHWSINGGTGAFVGATGHVVNAPPPGETAMADWSVDIYMTCP